MGIALRLIGATLAIAASSASPAAADGDPASDVLATYRVFDPVDLNAPHELAQLNAVLATSARAGFPIKVALIASASDLGTATAYWRNPGGYSDYLGYELSDISKGQILIVMPNGFGLYTPPDTPRTTFAKEHAVRAESPAAGTQLITAAISAVPALARAAGHPFNTSGIQASADTAAKGPDTPPAAWIALAGGMLLIAGSWYASLKARPLNVRRSTSQRPRDS